MDKGEDQLVDEAPVKGPPADAAAMQITRLKLSGFKSFVEPSELRIERGLTGIVGPNGCGKSNLLEAIRWVMGENSPKSMRSGGMEDVIFAGTADRPARNFAEVSLLAEVSHQVLAGVSNDDGELEVVRRIERGAGSAYRANGRDVRAKDIALIFADAATGAHSPALVSQGKIANVISAKPTDRRLMLEEAAGISGLHVRRKDAEQKLRATSANLERLQELLAAMALRADSLRKQARAAERYRKLSQEITMAEARLVFARWRSAAEAARAARAEADLADEQVAEAQTAADAVRTEQQQAISELGAARAQLDRARDAAADVARRLAQAESERDTTRQRLSDLERQAARIAEDSAREDRLTHEAAEALARLEEAAAELKAEIAAEEARLPELAQQADRAERAARESEVALARAVADHARTAAEIRVADAAAETARTRAARTQAELDKAERALAELGDADALAAIQREAKQQAEASASELETAATTLAELNDARPQLAERREACEAELSSARAELQRLAREADALRRDLAAGAGSGSGEIALDRVRAAKGYETALAAALGEDLSAAIGALDDEGRFWTGQHVAPASESAPEGCERLADHVRAPDALAARLSQIFVAESDTGQPLAVGQRLVTLEGRMRRWDGFVSSGEGAGAAERLARQNRLESLEERLPGAERAASESEATLEAARDALAELHAKVADATHRREAADRGHREALRALDQSDYALARDGERREELNERIATLRDEREAAETARQEAEAARAALPDGTEQQALVERLEAESEATRGALRSAQAARSALDQQLAQARERRAGNRAETKGWEARSSEAMQRLRDMQRRAGELDEERAALAGKPAELESRVERLSAEQAEVRERLTGCEAEARRIEDALRALEARLADRAEALTEARERRAGANARAENEDNRRQEMARISGERFQCPPPVLPERHGFDAETIGDAAAESAEHERLQQSRDRLGPVNLVAADELAELDAEVVAKTAEHDELDEAVNRLRGSIGSLNREGRQRLLAAFQEVDQHFQQLFERLFSGGSAHLALVDSDDPLEAGLEIMAQPPGKRLSSLSLLSGGEQTLTAVALIFALFLTNPAPICVLDEVDAPLDDANIERFCDLLDHMVRDTATRYLIVTHNAVTMSRMHRLFGVTMIEKGISKLVSVDLGGAEELLAAE